ncbi:MAG: hypothetical protein AAFR88_03475 [Pseudomonadota bacterium]
MVEPPTLLGLAAIGLYGCVSLTCLFALAQGAWHNQRLGHVAVWTVLVLLFALLAIWRFFGIEEALRDLLREWLRDQGSYSSRRSLQRPLAGALIGLAAVGAMVWFYRAAQAVRGRRSVALVVAMASAAAMIALVLLRLISLSPVDQVLYGLKLNWVLDIGLSLTALGAAVFYARALNTPR